MTVNVILPWARGHRKAEVIAMLLNFLNLYPISINIKAYASPLAPSKMIKGTYRRISLWPWRESDFPDQAQEAQTTKEKINILNFIKTKYSCLTKDPTKGKTSDRSGKDIHNQYNKRIISRIYNEFIQINNKKKKNDNHPYEKGLKDLKRHFCENRKPKTHVKIRPVSGLIRETQIKTRIRYCFTSRNRQKFYF